MSDSLTILIADDNDSDRMILSALLKKEGHVPILAENGQVAVELFRKHRPDLVLMDALMPVMDGFEATREIKAITNAETELVPIIFLTSLQEVEALAKCLDVGAEDFLSKPYNRVVLKAKLKSFGRMRLMHSRLQEHHRQILIEQRVAKNIFDNVVHLGHLDDDSVNYSLSPLSIFNGDTVLANRKPDGGMHFFLGDFTGHGLPAAIGVMPLAEIFYGMTRKGYAIEDILREMNRKLRRILPVGVFCCGTMIDMNFFDGITRVWVGGTPDAMFFSPASGEVRNIPSKNLPLGVVDNSSMQVHVEEFFMEDGDRVFCWSDGIHESRNEAGDMFGEQRIKDVLTASSGGDDLVQALVRAVDSYMGTAERDDDITVLEATMIPHQEQDALSSMAKTSANMAGPQDWEVNYKISGSSLKDYNPLPLVLQIITEVDSLKSISGQLYTLLAELFSNALEHGILQLSSELKHDPRGFAEYYAERTERLDKLTNDDFIRISALHSSREGGGCLQVRIEDTGGGFDYRSVLERRRTNREYSGRGLPLLAQICDELEYEGNGNIAVATLEWPRQKQA